MNMITHGMTGTPTYNSYKSMINRCLSSNNIAYKRYGGVGITVCKRWLDIKYFIEDMGLRPDKTTLERIDNDKGYSKENCRWATRIEQARNMKTNNVLTLNGETMCLVEWAEKLNIKRSTLSMRIHTHKWSIEKALTTSLRSGGYKKSVTRNGF